MNIKNRICLVNEECVCSKSAGFSQTSSHSLITVIRVWFHEGYGYLTPIHLPSRSQAFRDGYPPSPFQAVSGTRQPIDSKPPGIDKPVS